MELPWEDNLLERKVESDLKDLLKTLVAFANSVKPGHTAVLLIGERNDGSVDGVASPESIQGRVRKEAERIYPPIVWRSQVYEKQGKPCVRVEVEHSGDTPHFGGPAWVRRGESTVKASDEVFQRLIELRLGITSELSRWMNMTVSVEGDDASVPPPREVAPARLFAQAFYRHRWASEDSAKLIFINRFWVTLERASGACSSEPLSKLTLSYDDEQDRLKLIIAY